MRHFGSSSSSYLSAGKSRLGPDQFPRFVVSPSVAECFLSVSPVCLLWIQLLYAVLDAPPPLPLPLPLCPSLSLCRLRSVLPRGPLLAALSPIYVKDISLPSTSQLTPLPLLHAGNSPLSLPLVRACTHVHIRIQMEKTNLPVKSSLLTSFRPTSSNVEIAY